MQFNPGIESFKIWNYMKGSLEMEEVGITRKNGRAMLNIIKSIDIAIAKLRKHRILSIKRSTYDLRTHILKLCSPEMQTCEVYSKNTDTKKNK